MPNARVKDIEMYYEVHGTGTPLVHIGGLAGDARAWARQIEHLSKHYQVICFDNRGTGRTSCPDMVLSAQSGHAHRAQGCLLLGAKQTSVGILCKVKMKAL